MAFGNIHGMNHKTSGTNAILWNNVFYHNGYIDIFQLGGATTARFENNIFEGGLSRAVLYRDSGSWGTHDHNNYYDKDYATQGDDGTQTIDQWIGSGDEEENSVNMRFYAHDCTSYISYSN